MKKGFIRNFLPDYRFEKITDIGLDFFSGSQSVIFDLDNTLVFPETINTTEEIKNWFYNLQEKYKCAIVSNSRTFSKRSGAISQIFDCDTFLSKHKKPSKKLFAELKEKYGFENGKVFVVGDRIFSDILFGNSNGAKTILVGPISDKEYAIIKIIRILEKITLSGLKFFGYN